jgi:Pyruvate/2-oxoacid:ferredoxin oxidoreductase delta subunit
MSTGTLDVAQADLVDRDYHLRGASNIVSTYTHIRVLCWGFCRRRRKSRAFQKMQTVSYSNCVGCKLDAKFCRLERTDHIDVLADT